MIRLRHLALLALLASPGALRAQAVASSPAGISFEHGFQLTINGNGPFTYTLNTAMPSALYLDASVSGDLGLPVVAHKRIRILDQAEPPHIRMVDVVRIDELTLNGTVLHNISGVSTPQDGAAMLGLEAFRNLTLTLDYPNDRLLLSPQPLPAPDQRTIFHYTGDTVSPVLPITLNGIAMQAHLEPSARDVGSDVMVPLAIGLKLPLLGPMHEDGYFADDVGHNFLRWRATLKGDLVLGDITIHNPSLMLTNRNNYVNLAGICNRLRLRYDLANQLIELRLAPGASATQLP